MTRELYDIPLHSEFQEAWELSFREPLRVTEAVYYISQGYSFPRCPRCRITLEREYTAYCDRCGQALDWAHFDHALIQLI